MASTGTGTGTATGVVSVFGRLVAVRGFTIFVVLLLAMPFLVGITAQRAYRRVLLPDIGLDVDAKLGVEARDERWVGVHQRDHIVALGGQPLRDPSDWIDTAVVHAPEELVVTFERDGRRFDVTARPRAMRESDQVAVFARILTAAVLMVMGLLVFVARPGATITWLMMILSWDLGAFLLVKIGYWHDPVAAKEMTVFPWTIMTSVGLHLSSFFPQRIAWFARRPWRTLLLYGPVVAAPFIQFLHLVTRASAVGTAIAAVGMIVVVSNIAQQYRRARTSGDARVRAQNRALLVGFALGLVVPAAWNYARISLDIWNSPWAAHYNALPLVIFIGVTAYSIVRHNSLDIDRFTAAIVGYGITTILVGGSFVGALVGIPLALRTSGLGQSPTLLVATTAFTFAGFAPVYRLIRRWVDRRFFREQMGTSEIADSLRSLVISMQGSRDAALAAAFSGAEVLRSDRVELWLVNQETRQLKLDRQTGLGEETPAPIALTGPLGEVLSSGLSGGVNELAPRTIAAAAQEELWAHELVMMAPLMSRGQVAGFIGVGRKRSGAGYSLEELSFLAIIGVQLGAVLERTSAETQIDRYQLDKRVGTGGMAEVFLAWQVGPGGFERKVALKRPLPHVSEDSNAVAAFLDEARLAAQLVHTNIARVYDVGESKGSYFIVMEYCDGPSLRQILAATSQQATQVPVAIAVALMANVLSALDYAHHARDERGRELQLVHRDVSPRNILLNRAGHPKLVDFGIARAQGQLHVTQTGVVKGTLPYMSPEQASDHPLDHRSDVYAAACVFYELLTGVTAYPKGPGTKPPRPASTLVKDVPVAVDRAFEKATESNPERRFASAAAFATALTDAVPPADAATVASFLRTLLPQQMDPADMVSTTQPDDQSGPQTVIEVPFSASRAGEN